MGPRDSVTATPSKPTARPSVSPSGDPTARERLIAAAAELFTQKGYAATTVREIVAAADVTKPVLYYYFQNKEGIYLELIRAPYKKFESLLDAFQGNEGSASKRLLCLFEQVFSLLVENIEAARLMYSIYYGPPQGAPFFDFDTYHLKFQDTIRRLVQHGIRQGEFQKGDADDMVWALLGAVNVAMEAQLCHPELGMDRKKLCRIVCIILKGISTGAKKAKVRKS
jgi:TetR/AcrR family transcriptional regulator